MKYNTENNIKIDKRYKFIPIVTHKKISGYIKFEMSGATIKRLCEFKSKFNPSLEFNFSLQKKDNLGKIAEWIFEFYKEEVIT